MVVLAPAAWAGTGTVRASAKPNLSSWLLVADGNDGALDMVNPLTGSLAARYSTGGPASAPTAVALAGGSAWVADYRSGAVTRLDLVTGVTTQVLVGGRPVALVSAGGYLYVADAEGSRLVVIDPATARVLRSISVPAGPIALAASDGGSKLWVLSATAGSLESVEASSGELGARIPVGRLPQGVTVVGDTAYVTVEPSLPATYNSAFPIGGGSSPFGGQLGNGLVDDGALKTVDLATGKVTAAYRVGLDPEGVAVSGSTAVVANAGDGTVDLVDLASGRLDALKVGDGPQQVILNSSTLRAYVSLAGAGRVAVISLTARRPLDPVVTGGEPLGLSFLQSRPAPPHSAPLVCAPSGHGPGLSALGEPPIGATPTSTPWTAYVANAGGDDVSVVDVTSRRVVGTMAVGKRPSAVGVSPNGRRVYVANFGDNTVTVVDAATRQTGPVVPAGANPNAIAITPDGSEALVTDYGDNAVTPIDLTNERPLPAVPVGGGPSSIAITPDGELAYLVDSDSDAVTVIDVLTSTVWSEIPVGYNPQGIAITPDGLTAFVTNAGYLRNADAGTVTPINTATEQTAKAIPVGRYPVYPVVTAGDETVYVPNSNSGSVTPISVKSLRAGTPIPAGDGPDALGASPDGAAVFAVDLLGQLPRGALTPISTATRTPEPEIPVGYGPIAIGVTPAVGYYLVSGAGDVTGFGSARLLGTSGPARPTASVVAAALDPDTGGLWLLSQNGSVSGIRAPDFGGVGKKIGKSQAAVAIAALGDGTGYRVLTSAGVVWTVSNTAISEHHLPSTDLSVPVAIATDDCTGGYWVLRADGTVIGVGAPTYGGRAVIGGSGPAVALAPTQDGRGYWIAYADGIVLGRGSGRGSFQIGRHIRSVATGPATGGFWVLTSGGRVLGVGAPTYPGPSAAGATALVAGLASTPR